VLIGPVYPYRGGIAHFTMELAASIREAGHEVRIISFKRQYPKILYPGKSDLDPSQEVISVPAEYILDPLHPWTWGKARKFIVDEKPDLVVFQWWTTFWAPGFGTLARWLKRSGIKNTFLIHNVYPHERKIYDKALVKFALKPADAFIVMADTQKNHLLELFPHKTVHLTPHPTYTFINKEKLDKNTAKEQLGIPHDRKVALFFGIVRPYKGLKLLIEAAGMLKNEGKPVHLLIAGEFWEDINEYHKLIRAYGLSEWVTIYNRYIPNEEVPLIFNAADVFVAPYLNGTQSGAVKLAGGFKLPIIVTPIIVDDNLKISLGKYLFISDSYIPKYLKDTIKNALSTSFNNFPEPNNDQSRYNLFQTIQEIIQVNHELTLQ